ncbi:MAG: hypothetical protein RMM29_05370 [Planctomycetota bacterium]|nr:hypothetical protein [Planctomycetota bacterium]MCX8040592.1 hypothetical protein [Planctomycetota bacterium]MDW8373064.1 hypothetical protein [Planctomycetota bacterium]
MRLVIGAAAFLVPCLLAIAVGGTCAAPPATAPPQLVELAAWMSAHASELEALALSPGTATTALPPALATRFDLAGSDYEGQLWLRLRDRDPPCGIMRRERPQDPATVLGERPAQLWPLSASWWWWSARAAGAP